MLLVIHSSSTGASGFIAKSCRQLIRVRSGPSSSYRHRMCMYSNGPVSTRCARTSHLSRFQVRSETQDQTVPSASGCMLNRNRTRSSPSSSTSTAEYSVNSSGQPRTSLVMAQTKAMGASMTISFSV